MCPYDTWPAGTVSFCEARLCEAVREPANAWSNIAYVIVGLYLLVRARGTVKAQTQAIGITTFGVGLGSFFFHMTASFYGELCDLSAMYLVSGLMLTLELSRYVRFSRHQLVTLYCGLVVVPIALVVWFRTVGIALFALEIGATVVLLVLGPWLKPGFDYRPMRALVSTYGVASLIWTADKTGLVCAPENHVFNGHSLWHVLGALCMVIFAAHRRACSVMPQEALEPRDVSLDQLAAQ